MEKKPFRLIRNYMLGTLDFLFVEALINYPCISESLISKKYEEYAHSKLSDDMKNCNMNLISVIKNNYIALFKIIPGPPEFFFLRVNFIDKPIDILSNNQYLTSVNSSDLMQAIEYPSDDHLIEEFNESDNKLNKDVSFHNELNHNKLNDSEEPIILINDTSLEVKVSLSSNDYDQETSKNELIKLDLPPPGFENFNNDYFLHELNENSTNKLLNENCNQETLTLNVLKNKNEVEKELDISFNNDKLNNSYEEKKAISLENYGLLDFFDNYYINNNKNKKNVYKYDNSDLFNEKEQTNEHFYESDFENDFKNSKSTNMSETDTKVEKNIETKFKNTLIQNYILSGNYIINYEEASTARKIVVEKVLKKLSSNFEFMVIEWAKSITNVSYIFNILKRLHFQYPNGFTVQELCAFEEDLKINNEHIVKHTSLTSLICLIDNNMIRFDSNELFVVANEVLNVKLQYLKKNFCSNFYRLLYSRNGSSKIKDLIFLLNTLVPENVPINYEAIIRLCNCFPLIFTLECNPKDNFDCFNAIVRLNSAIPEWQIVFDNGENEIDGTLCDCENCCS